MRRLIEWSLAATVWVTTVLKALLRWRRPGPVPPPVSAPAPMPIRPRTDSRHTSLGIIRTKPLRAPRTSPRVPHTHRVP